MIFSKLEFLGELFGFQALLNLPYEGLEVHALISFVPFVSQPEVCELTILHFILLALYVVFKFDQQHLAIPQLLFRQQDGGLRLAFIQGTDGLSGEPDVLQKVKELKLFLSTRSSGHLFAVIVKL